MSAPFKQFPGLAEAWTERSPGERVRKLRKAAEGARERLLSDGPVAALATRELVTFPYPALFAFSGGARSPAPFVMMTNAMHVVQFEQDGALKTLLFNPTDYQRGKHATFYVGLRKRYGAFLSDKVIPTYFGEVPEQLGKLSISPAQVDYIAYDHLHVQDLRGWLGPGGMFPNARLIVQATEWRSVRDLHPMNQVWYVPGGFEGIPEDRVIQIDGDIWLGKGLAFLSTPGHTLGNMSMVVVTPDGPFVVSENGVAAESYTPLQSAIPGVRAYAEQMGYEVVLNGNTREGSLDQYSSMIVEKTLAGPARADPAFINFFPSSQLTASMLAPGLAPTFSHRPPEHGTLRRATAASKEAA
jgi:hypothetical protein